MKISDASKNAIYSIIYERAYEIENKLSEDNYFLAKMAGLKPEQIEEVSLKLAIKELKESIKEIKTI